MKLLVTGGAGYIGGFLTIELLKKGYKVDIVDTFFRSSENFINRINKITQYENIDNSLLSIYRGDIGDDVFLDNVFKKAIHEKYPVNVVIHLAGFKSIYESNQNPILYWENNFSKTLNLIKIMELNKCKNFIFSSSATVYGDSYQTLKENFT